MTIMFTPMTKGMTVYRGSPISRYRNNDRLYVLKQLYAPTLMKFTRSVPDNVASL